MRNVKNNIGGQLKKSLEKQIDGRTRELFRENIGLTMFLMTTNEPHWVELYCHTPHSMSSISTAMKLIRDEVKEYYNSIHLEDFSIQAK